MTTREHTLEQRVADLEALMHDIVKGRIRTDLLFSELERHQVIPEGSNELADQLMASYEKRFQEKILKERVENSSVIPLAFGRRLAELRDEMVEGDQALMSLALCFQRSMGNINNQKP